jgi:hypothetical protein
MSPDATLRVYVNAGPVDVPKSATVLEAVMRADPELAAGVRSGDRTVTDSRGLPVDPGAPLHGGAILRVTAARHRET